MGGRVCKPARLLLLEEESVKYVQCNSIFFHCIWQNYQGEPMPVFQKLRVFSVFFRMTILRQKKKSPLLRFFLVDTVNKLPKQSA